MLSLAVANVGNGSAESIKDVSDTIAQLFAYGFDEAEPSSNWYGPLHGDDRARMTGSHESLCHSGKRISVNDGS